MPKQKRRSLPGVVVLVALIVLAIALGVYGNKIVTGVSSETRTGTGVTQTLTEVPTTTEISTSTTSVSEHTNTTTTQAP